MRIGMAVAAVCVVGVGCPVLADDSDTGAASQQRLTLAAPLVAPELGASAPGLQALGLTPDTANVGSYLSGGLAFRLDYAISDHWGVSGALDWSRHRADGPDDDPGDGRRPVDSILASGQISFEF